MRVPGVAMATHVAMTTIGTMRIGPVRVGTVWSGLSSGLVPTAIGMIGIAVTGG